MDRAQTICRMHQRLLINVKSQIFKMLEDGHSADSAYDMSSTALSMLLADYIKVYVKEDKYHEVLDKISSEALAIAIEAKAAKG